MQVLNPIFDTSFKYLMEDDKSARILLSSILKKRVVKLEPRPQERSEQFPNRGEKDLNIYRLDYSAKLVLDGGEEEDVCIELQKVWLKSELLRFRRYIASQYADPNNLCQDGETPMHIIAIYLLGHKLDESDEPIIYCRGNSMTDYNGNPIVPSGRGNFIRSLTHDVIIVQIPCLAEKPRNATERLLSIFDQRKVEPSNRRLICLPDDSADKQDDSGFGTLANSLMKGTLTEDMLKKMEIEEEIFSEFEYRDLKTEQYRKKLEESEVEKETIKAEKKAVEAENETIKAENETIKAEKEAMKTEMDSFKQTAVCSLAQMGMSAEQIAAQFNLDVETVRKYI